jgi:hypothetical protein
MLFEVAQYRVSFQADMTPVTLSKLFAQWIFCEINMYLKMSLIVCIDGKSFGANFAFEGLFF